jgi:hypothetical protein
LHLALHLFMNSRPWVALLILQLSAHPASIGISPVLCCAGL